MAASEGEKVTATPDEGNDSSNFKILLRDLSPSMVEAWENCAFGTDGKYKDRVEISQGDIFDGGPAADAIVSPANSFGFMDGGIDMAYSRHFGWQMMERLQEVIRNEHDGELLVGDAIIIPSYPPDTDYKDLSLSPSHNEGKPIKYLVSAPTMRVPCDVMNTVNAYLAFRAVLRAVVKHNSKCAETGQDPIRSVLCPGLGTAVGRMPFQRCAEQMVKAYGTIIDKSVHDFIKPTGLWEPTLLHEKMLKVGSNTDKAYDKKAYPGEIFVEEQK